MTSGEALKRIIAASSAFQAIASNRIFPVVAPQIGHAPFSFFWSGGREIVETLEGGVNMIRDRYFIRSSAKDAFTAEALDDAIFKALVEYSGTVENDDVSPAETLLIEVIEPMPRPQHESMGFSDSAELYDIQSGFEIVYLMP
jgi:hypothetical protein